MTNTAKEFIKQAAARYGIYLRPDDPLVAPLLLLEENKKAFMEESRNLVQVLQEESRAVMSHALTVLAQELEFGAFVRQAKTDIEKIQHLYNMRMVISIAIGFVSGVVIAGIIAFLR